VQPPSPPEPEAEQTEQEREDQRRRDLGLPLDAPEELVAAAEGDTPARDDETGDEKEATVLDFLLGPTVPLEFDVDTFIDTPSGREKLVFHIKQIDDTRIDELEKDHSEGEGPFRRVNRIMLNAAKVAEATVYLEDADGRRIDPGAPEFRGPIPDRADAFRGRFKFQPGILSMVASEIDAAAGMTNDRVGTARRAPTGTAEKSIATAVKNS
jgi:hypothetical protein